MKQKVLMLEKCLCWKKCLCCLCWKVCTIAILLNTLISIKDYAKSCQRKFIHCLAHENIWFRSKKKDKMESTCWCGLRYFKLEEIFSNRVSKRSCPWKPFSVLKTFQECERQNLNVNLEGKASAEVKFYPYISLGNFHFSTFYFLRYAQVQNQKDGMENSGK